jgi:chitinase
VDILSPQDGATFTPADEYVVIQPNVVDNISMDRVEFYVDGELVATSTVAPFNERWMITNPGRHFIELRAYDTAGNMTVSKRLTITVEPD